MIDINTILENDMVKGLLKKAGVSDSQARSVAKQALDTIKGKFDQKPKEMSSLISDNPNTPEDESLQQEVEQDFASNLSAKAGLSPDIVNSLKGMLPGVISQFSSSLSLSGSNNEQGISGMLGGLMEMFGGDDGAKAGKSNSGSGGVLAKILALFSGKKK